MNQRVIVLDEAEDELIEAQKWYETQRPYKPIPRDRGPHAVPQTRFSLCKARAFSIGDQL
jgi:hypothetical protein